MTVYVDNGKIAYGRMIMCHMIADNIDELHMMAAVIGVNQKWFQNKRVPHYDICQSKRKLAIKNGAMEVDRRKIVELIRKFRRSNHGNTKNESK